MMKLCFMGIGGAVGALRSAIPRYFMALRGHHVIDIGEGSTLSEDEQNEAVLTCDLIHVVSSGTWSDRPEAMKASPAPVVLDVDDDLHASHEGRTGLASARILRDFEECLREAAAVTTTQEHLAGVLRSHGAKDVHVCPNGLIPQFFRQEPRQRRLLPGSVLEQVKASKQRGGPAIPPRRRIGWTGSASHASDLPPALQAIRRVASVDAAVSVCSLGPVDLATLPEWKGASVDYWRAMLLHAKAKDAAGREREVWVPGEVGYRQAAVLEKQGHALAVFEFESYMLALEKMDPCVAVVPLAESDFNRSKSGITPMSWAAKGTPCVLSRVGPYATLEAEGFPARYVAHEDETAWTDAIRDLIYRPTEAEELGQAAQKWVAERYSYPKLAERWEAAFLAVIEKRRNVGASR